MQVKYLRKLLFSLLFLFLLAVGVSAAPYTFTTMDGTCDVDTNGNCSFRVTAVVNFQDAVTEFTIPLGQNVSNAQAEIYHTSVRKENGVSVLVFEREAGFAGEMNVTWTYTVRNTVATASDKQVFTVPLLAAQSGDVAALSYTVTMPGSFDSNPVFNSGYYADGIDNYMTVAISEGVITASVNQVLMAGDALTMSLTTEPGYFSMRDAAGRTVTADTIILVLCFLLAIGFWLWKLRYALPRITIRSHPPTGANAGILRHLITDDNPDLPLMCAGWAASGYLSIHQDRTGAVRLQQRMSMGNERDVYETKVFQALFSKANTVFAGTRKYRSVEQYAQNPVRHFWHQRLYQKNAPTPLPLRIFGILGGLAASLCTADTAIGSFRLRMIPVILLALLGGILCWFIQEAARRCLFRNARRDLFRGLACALILQIGGVIAGTGGMMLAGIVLQVLIGLSLVFGVRRSRNGVTMLEQTLSLRRYLAKFKASDTADLQGQASQYYYQMLPYAEALGVGRKFTKAFAGVTLETCNWFTTEDPANLREPAQFYQSFHRCILAMHNEGNRFSLLELFQKPQAQQKRPQSKNYAHPATRPTAVDRQKHSGEYNHEHHRNNDPRRRS